MIETKRKIVRGMFSGFLITYNRQEKALSHLESVFNQSFPPIKVLVVDNSDYPTLEALLYERFSQDQVEYKFVGDNVGPAGAAKIGIEWAYRKKFPYVVWMDDGNPPVRKDIFEKLIEAFESDRSGFGALGSVGAKFDWARGEYVRYLDSELKGLLEADYLAGGYFPVLKMECVGIDVLPDPGIFFGHTEFDYFHRLKKNGVKIGIHGDLMLELRTQSNRTNLGKKNATNKDAAVNPIRRYYSTRNLLVILWSKNKRLLPFLYVLLKSIFRPLKDLREGRKMAKDSLRYSYMGIYDFFRGRMGRRDAIY